MYFNNFLHFGNLYNFPFAVSQVSTNSFTEVCHFIGTCIILQISIVAHNSAFLQESTSFIEVCSLIQICNFSGIYNFTEIYCNLLRGLSNTMSSKELASIVLGVMQNIFRLILKSFKKSSTLF